MKRLRPILDFLTIGLSVAAGLLISGVAVLSSLRLAVLPVALSVGLLVAMAERKMQRDASLWRGTLGWTTWLLVAALCGAGLSRFVALDGNALPFVLSLSLASLVGALAAALIDQTAPLRRAHLIARAFAGVVLVTLFRTYQLKWAVILASIAYAAVISRSARTTTDSSPDRAPTT